MKSSLFPANQQDLSLPHLEDMLNPRHHPIVALSKAIAWKELKVLLAGLLALLICLLASCATFETQTVVKNRKIPRTYLHTAETTTSADSLLLRDTTTIADVRWREFFQDSLLVHLIDTALHSNLSLQAALQRIEFAKANSIITKGELFPKVFANLGGGVRKFGLYTMDGAGNIATEILPGKIVPIDLPDFSVGLQSTWEIDIWDKLRNKNEAAAAQYLASIEGIRFVITALIAEIAALYYELIALDNEIDILRQTLRKQQEALNVIQLQKEAAKTNELAVQQFEAQVLNTQVLEKEVSQSIIVRENMLNYLLGRFPQPIRRNKNSLFQTLPQRIASGVPAQLLQNRPDIRAAELELYAAKCDVEAAKAAFLPSLSLSAGIGFQAFDPQFLFLAPASLAYNALGNLVAPLINRNALEAQFHSASASQIQAMANYQQSILNGYVEVTNELSNVRALQSIDSLKIQQSAVLKESVDIATELYKSAKASYLEILIAQQASLQAQIELVGIKKRQRIAFINLYKALGGGWR